MLRFLSVPLCALVRSGATAEDARLLRIQKLLSLADNNPDEHEARAAFAFLTDQGFAVGTAPPLDAHRRPACVTVTFQAPSTTVETVLVLGFAGEDSIVTALRTVTGSTESDRQSRTRVTRSGSRCPLMRRAFEPHSRALDQSTAHRLPDDKGRLSPLRGGAPRW